MPPTREYHTVDHAAKVCLAAEPSIVTVSVIAAARMTLEPGDRLELPLEPMVATALAVELLMRADSAEHK